MTPEVAVRHVVILSVPADSVSPFRGERMVRLARQEPAWHHAIRSRASESEEPRPRVLVDPLVERRDAEDGAVGPDTTVLGEQGDADHVTQGRCRDPVDIDRRIGGSEVQVVVDVLTGQALHGPRRVATLPAPET